MHKNRSRPKLTLQRLDSPTADLRRILSTNQSCIHSTKRSPTNKQALLNLSNFSTTLVPTPKNLLLSLENTPIANENSNYTPHPKSPVSITSQALPRGSIVNLNKSPTPVPKSHLLNINPRSRASPGLPQHFLITEKRQDSSLSLRSIHSQSKKELSFPPKQPSFRLHNSPSRLVLNETLSIMNSPSHASLQSSTRNNNVSSERLKRIDDHVNRQKNIRIKKDILKKVFAEATSPVNSTPKYTKFLGFLDDTPKSNTTAPIHTKAPTGFLRIIKRKPERKNDQQPEQSTVINQSKENEPEEEEDGLSKLLGKNYFITSSTDLHKSVRAQYLFEPDPALLMKNSLGLKIKPFILEGFDPNTVKYNNIFVSKMYKKPRPVLLKKGSAQSQGSSGDSQPGSKTNLEEKSKRDKREESLEASVKRYIEKEKSLKNLLEEMKSTNISMSRELAYNSVVPKAGESRRAQKEGLGDKYYLFNSPNQTMNKTVMEEEV